MDSRGASVQYKLLLLLLLLLLSFDVFYCLLPIFFIIDEQKQKDGGGDVQWQRFDETFEVKQALLLNVKGVANRNELQQVTNHWIVVTGFAKSKSGEPGPAQAKG